MRLRAIAYDAYMVALNLLLRIPSHRARIAAMRYLGGNAVGLSVTIERGMKLSCKGGVTIGDNCNINARVILDGRGTLRIGSHVTIAPEVAVLTADHDPNAPDFAGRTRSVTIGDKAWIATRALLLPGTAIGDGAIVGAGAVVHGTVAEWTIVAGNPATRIGDRSRAAGPATSAYRRWFH